MSAPEDVRYFSNASSSDDGGATWVSGLRDWRYIAWNYELVDPRSCGAQP